MLEMIYDAFISYRHKDKKIAEKLQRLLEQYRPPHSIAEKTGIKRLGRVFLDRTELPTSSDLGASLTEALSKSKYLIVILTEEYNESKYCMEELRQFKKMCGGHLNRIIPVLVSGEPQNVLPEELLVEQFMEKGENGSTHIVTREIEPLCCDIRADSESGKMRSLNREYLRILAMILGCGYDELYQRNERRKHQRYAVLAGGVITILSLILGITLNANYNIAAAQKAAEKQLSTSFLRQGAEQTLDNNGEKALMYYCESLEHNPENESTQAATALLLQRFNWLYEKSSKLVHDETVAVEENSDSQNEYTIFGREIKTKSSQESNVHVLENGEVLTIVYGDANRILQVPYPKQISPNCLYYDPEYDNVTPEVILYHDDDHCRVLVNFGGYFYVYDFDEVGDEIESRSTPAWQVELTEVLPPDNYSVVTEVNPSYCMRVSNVGGLASIGSGEVAILNVIDLFVVSGKPWDYMDLLDVLFYPDGTGYGLVYNTATDVSAGSLVELYDGKGNCTGKTLEDREHEYRGAEFSENNDALLIWRAGSLELDDPCTGDLICPILQTEDLISGLITENGEIFAVDADGNGHEYGIKCFKQDISSDQETSVRATIDKDTNSIWEELTEKGYEKWKASSYSNIFSLENGFYILTDSRHHDLVIINRNGDVIDQITVSDDEYEYLNLCIDPLTGSIYIWKARCTSFAQYVTDKENGHLSLVNMLSANDLMISKVVSFSGGCAAQTLNGDIFIWMGTSPQSCYSFRAEGILKKCCFLSNGLLAVSVYDAGMGDESYLTVYDPELGAPISRLVETTDLGIIDIQADTEGGIYGAIGFNNDYELKYWKTNLNDITKKKASELVGLSCFELISDTQNVIRKTTMWED